MAKSVARSAGTQIGREIAAAHAVSRVAMSPSTTIGGDTFTVTQNITAQGQIDYEMGMAREFRRLERDRRTRTAGTR